MLTVINSSKTLIAYMYEKHFGGCLPNTQSATRMAPEKKNPILSAYTINGQTLGAVDTATYEVIELSVDLTRNKQVEKVAAKVNRTLSFIRRTVTTSSSQVKVVPYKTLVRPRPHMEYSAFIIDPTDTATDQQAGESVAPYYLPGHMRLPENG